MFRSLPSMILATTLALPAQTWNEVGDAGQLPNTAQVPGGASQTLLTIQGALPADDVDMYLIEIVDVGTFSASTVGGATFDTQLWLFFPDGRGVTCNDDTPPGGLGLQSTITGANVPFPGCYYLAVSSYDVDPQASSADIWDDGPFAAERAPDGPRRFEPVDDWTGPSFSNGPYTITLAGVENPVKQLLLPDDHYLTEEIDPGGKQGSYQWWRTTGGRFQVLYHPDHFLHAGVTGPMQIQKLMFRGQDGDPNLGGQSWANVSVEVGASILTGMTMTNDFTANRAASLMSPSFSFPSVVVQPSIGATPNNYNIVLDLTKFGPNFGWVHDPNFSLLIDVHVNGPAVVPPGAGPVMRMQDTTDIWYYRGNAITTADPTAATGQFAAPPVVGIKFDSASGGYSPPVPARNEFYGAGCGGSPSSFYEAFLTGQPFDLEGLTLTPDDVAAPSVYTVTAGAQPFDPTRVNASPDSTSDDGTVDHALGFSFHYPGGSTASIRATTNGYVWLETTGSADPRPLVDEFLDAGARLAPCWSNFHAGENAATHPNSGLHVLTAGAAPNRVCYVTWLHVSQLLVGSGQAAYDLQMAIFEASGVVEFRYGSMPVYGTFEAFMPGYHVQAGIVGFTRGRIGGTTPSVDPQSRDLSVEIPFTTAVEGSSGNIGQRAFAVGGVGAYGGARLFPGQSVRFDAVGVPAGAVIGVQLLDTAASRPGFTAPTVTAPDCMLRTTPAAMLYEVTLFPPATVAGTVPLLVPPGVEGFELFAQYVVLDGLLQGSDLITASSNALKLRVGLE